MLEHHGASPGAAGLHGAGLDAAGVGGGLEGHAHDIDEEDSLPVRLRYDAQRVLDGDEAVEVSGRVVGQAGILCLLYTSPSPRD